MSVDCGFPLVALITKQSLDDLGLAVGQETTATFKAHAVHLIARSGREVTAAAGAPVLPSGSSA